MRLPAELEMKALAAPDAAVPAQLRARILGPITRIGSDRPVLAWAATAPRSLGKTPSPEVLEIGRGRAALECPGRGNNETFSLAL